MTEKQVRGVVIKLVVGYLILLVCAIVALRVLEKQDIERVYQTQVRACRDYNHLARAINARDEAIRSLLKPPEPKPFSSDVRRRDCTGIQKP